jgi:hypothetical protein
MFLHFSPLYISAAKVDGAAGVALLDFWAANGSVEKRDTVIHSNTRFIDFWLRGEKYGNYQAPANKVLPER